MALSIEGGGLQFVAAINDSDFGKSIQRMEEQLRGLTQTAEHESDAMDNFGKKAALAIGSYLSLNAAQDFVKQIIDVRSQFQALDISFSTMLKSKEKANALMADVVKLAATTPFTLQQVGEGAKQLLAYGTGAEHVVDTLKMLGDVASGVGAPIGDLVYLYGTLQTQGRAYTRDILQFTSRGIPIIDELAKQFGVTKDKVQDLVEAGKVGFPQVEQAFKSLTGQGGIFFNLMDQQSKTLTGQISNLQDSFSQMLNEIGKGQEGILAGGIGGLKTLVDHYQDVADVLKVIVLSYGAYKAAVVVNTALIGYQKEALAGYTLAQQLSIKWTLLQEGATKTLNAVMAATPMIAFTAGIAAVTAAIYAMSTTSNAAAAALSKIADIQSEAAQAVAKEKDTIEQLLVVYNDQNKSQAEHAAALQKLIALNPTYLSGLNANNIATKEGKDIIDKYLKSLEDKAKGEAAYAAKQANLMKIVDLQTKGIGAVDNTERLGRSLKSFFTAQSDLSGINEDKAIVQQMIKELQAANSEIDKTFKDQIQKTVVGDTTTNDAAVASQKRTLAVIEAEIKAIKERQTAESVSRQQYLDYQKQITKLEAEAEAIRGASKAQIKEQQKAENELNAILEKRKSILDDLANLHRDATQSGLTKEASEVDKINEKYDLAIKKIQEFNAAHPKQQISAADIQAVGSDRATEVNNATLRQQAEDYKKSLDVQKDLFSQYEEAKKTIGIDKANEMFAGQKKDYSTYLDYLKAQQRDILDQASVVGNNVGLTEKLKAVGEGIVATEKANAQAAINETIRVIQATQTYADKRKQIEEKYQRDVAALQKNFTGEELKKRLEIVKDSRTQEITDLEDSIARQGALYQQLNTDIIRYTRDQLKQRLDLLKQYQKDGFIIEKDGSKTIITPQMKADLQQAIAQAKEFLSASNEVLGVSVQQLQEFAKYAAVAGQSFHSLASAISPMNAGLADTLDTIGQIADVAASAAESAAGFASGNIAGGISGAIGAITGVIKLFTAGKESAIKAAQELKTYQDSLLDSEVAYNELLRARQRTQQDLKDLTIAELEARKEMLKTQQSQAQADYNTLLAQIQASGQQITGEHTERYGGFLGIGRKTRVVQDLAGLSSSDYDELEKLFTEGKLTGQTKIWFEQLQKVHDELDGIGVSAKEAADQINQDLTGTTSSSILDSIVKGFADGKKATADFADNFKDLMKQAILNSFKYSALKDPIDKFYQQFAADAASGNTLDTSEIASLQDQYNKIISDANKQFADLQKITSISFDSANANGSANTLSGAIKSMSQQSADLLAGQFGGLRISNLEILDVANKQLLIQNKIEQNTAAAVVVMSDYYRNWTVNGLKVSL